MSRQRAAGDVLTSSNRAEHYRWRHDRFFLGREFNQNYGDVVGSTEFVGSIYQAVYG